MTPVFQWKYGGKRLTGTGVEEKAGVPGIIFVIRFVVSPML